MTIIDRVVEANRIYARTYSPQLGKRPEPKIAVVTCMDPRLSDLPGILGLPEADIDVIRTGAPPSRKMCSQSSLFRIGCSEPRRYCFSITPVADSPRSPTTS